MGRLLGQQAVTTTIRYRTPVGRQPGFLHPPERPAGYNPADSSPIASVRGALMPITFSCPCGKVLRAPDTAAGKRARCTACGEVLLVPGPEGEPADPSADPAAARQKKKPAVQVVEDDEDEPRPKKKKKMKRKVEGISREEYDEWSETSARRSYAAKRIIYIVAGLGAILFAAVAFLIFALNGMLGLYPLIAVGLGVLAGGYCVFQGVTGTFHER